MLIFVLAVVLFLGKTAHGLLSQLNTQPRMEPSASEPTIQLEDNSEAAVSHIEIPEVVELNVGGSYFTTSLSTLRKYPNSMLAVMFSGRHNLLTDKGGRYFIDRDGRLFEFVLNFLRQGELPPSSESLKVYQEAQFYNIDEMCEELELFRPVAGEKLRKDFLTRVANYEENLYMLMKNAQHTAFTHPTRICRLTVCVYKEENPSIPHNIINSEPVAGEWRPYKTQITHTCDVNVSFGPWNASMDVYDLIDCIKHDLALKGYQVDHKCIGVCDQHITGQYYCKRPIYEFKIKWW